MSIRNSVYATLFPHKKKPVPVLPMSSDDLTASGDDIGIDTPIDSIETVPASPAEIDETERQFPAQTSPKIPPKTLPPVTDFSSVKDYSPYQKAKADYETAVAAPVKHQNPFLQALFIGLQGAQKFFDPNNREEIKFLGEAKHDRDVEQAARRLAPLEQQQQSELKNRMQEAQLNKLNVDAETDKIDTETRRKGLELRAWTTERNSMLRQLGLMKRYKRGENPKFDEKLQHLDIEQPDFEPDKKLKPRYWDYSTGKLMTFDDNNATVPALTPDGKEIINESKKEVLSGGYYVSPNVARSADATVEASQIGAANKTGDNSRDYQVKVSELKGRIASATNRVNAAKAKITRYENPQTKEDYEAKAKAESELTAAESDLVGLETELKTLPPPQKVQGLSGGKIVSKSELELFAKEKGWTPQQAQDFATRNGWTIK